FRQRISLAVYFFCRMISQAAVLVQSLHWGGFDHQAADEKPRRKDRQPRPEKAATKSAKKSMVKTRKAATTKPRKKATAKRTLAATTSRCPESERVKVRCSNWP